MKKKLLLALFIPSLLLTGCGGSKEEPKKEYFSLWNECASLTKLKDFVNDVTNKDSSNYIPVEDRIATFDMDGTFVGELYPTYFEYNMLEYRVLDDPTYKNVASEEEREVAQEIRDFVRNGTKLPDRFDMRHAYAAAKAYSGLTVGEFDTYVKEYAKKTPFGFTGMTYATSFYKPMLEVFDYLKDNDFTYYVVSGSDRYICRALVDSLGIPSERVIGMDVTLKATKQGNEEGVNYTFTKEEDMIRTDELIIKNLKTNKIKQILTDIGKTPVLSFGNSSGDSAMHNFCLSNKKYKSDAFMLIADDDVRDHANLVETAKRKASWEKANYNIISMKDDFKTIYGEGVEKVDFVYDKSPVKEVSYTEFEEEVAKTTLEGFNVANVELETEDIRYDVDGAIVSHSNDKLYSVIHYDSETAEYINDGNVPGVYAEKTYCDTVDNPLDIDSLFNDNYFQNKEGHYYVGEGFRGRYLGSGSFVEAGVNYDVTTFEVKKYDDKGALIYEETLSTLVNKDTNEKIVKKSILNNVYTR